MIVLIITFAFHLVFRSFLTFLGLSRVQKLFWGLLMQLNNFYFLCFFQFWLLILTWFCGNLFFERIIESESCSTIWVDPKTVFEPNPDPKNSTLRPQKVKNVPKIKSKSKAKSIIIIIGGYNKCGKKASITSKVVTKVIR